MTNLNPMILGKSQLTKILLDANGCIKPNTNQMEERKETNLDLLFLETNRPIVLTRNKLLHL